MSPIQTLTRKHIDEKGYSLRDVAKAINYSHPSLSQYMSGKYGAGVGKIESALLTWLRREGVSINGVDAEASYIDTATTEAVMNACNSALEEGILAAIIGPPGVGKTHALRRWQEHARREELRFIVITANVLTSAVSIARDLGVALGLRDRTAAQLVSAIIEKLRREPSVLIIDEAQHLNVRALETIRAIHDATMTGVVFCGSLALSRTLEEGDVTSVELAQLQDRIAIVERVKPLSPLEVTRFVRNFTGIDTVDAATMEEIRNISRGIPRRLVRLLTHTRRLVEGSSRPMSVAMVREAGKRLVAA